MEGLRAYAAGIVYLLHLVSSFVYFRHGVGFGELSLSELAELSTAYIPTYWIYRSHYGVDIFFLLSGYLIAGLVLKPSFSYPKFLYHRFLRIYPTLIVTTLCYVAYSVFVEGGSVWLGGIVGNLLLLNGVRGYDFPAINVVTWSLFFEFAFYFTFPLLWRLCGANLRRFVVVSFVLIIPLLYIHESYIRFAMFIAGVILKVAPESALSRCRALLREWQVIVLYMFSTLLFMFTQSWPLFIVCYFIPALLLVDRSINSNGILARILSKKPLRYFGNISFSFYLFHLLGLTASRGVLSRFQIESDYIFFGLYFALSFLIAFCLSALCFAFVEKQYFSNRGRFDRFYTRIVTVAGQR